MISWPYLGRTTYDPQGPTILKDLKVVPTILKDLKVVSSKDAKAILKFNRGEQSRYNGSMGGTRKHWSALETSKLIAAVNDQKQESKNYTGRGDLRINFDAIANTLKTRTTRQCDRRWKLIDPQREYQQEIDRVKRRMKFRAKYNAKARNFENKKRSHPPYCDVDCKKDRTCEAELISVPMSDSPDLFCPETLVSNINFFTGYKKHSPVKSQQLIICSTNLGKINGTFKFHSKYSRLTGFFVEIKSREGDGHDRALANGLCSAKRRKRSLDNTFA